MAQGRSPWFWVGIGCASVVAIVAIVVVAVVWFGWQMAQDVAEGMRDPAAKQDAVLEMLGTDALPEGYRPAFVLSFPPIGPRVFDVAMLTDAELPLDRAGNMDEAGARLFETITGDARLFIWVSSFKEADVPIGDAFASGADVQDLFGAHSNLDLDVRNEIERGILDRPQDRVYWMAKTGRIELDQGSREGVFSVLVVECPGDARQRFGIWMQPQPEGADPSDPSTYAGTVADPAEIEAFLEPISPCPSAG